MIGGALGVVTLAIMATRLAFLIFKIDHTLFPNETNGQIPLPVLLCRPLLVTYWPLMLCSRDAFMHSADATFSLRIDFTSLSSGGVSKLIRCICAIAL